MALKPSSPTLLCILILGIALTVTPTNTKRPAFACGESSPTKSLQFCRQSLPIRTRVEDLIQRLTVDEKVQLLVNNAAGVPRLDIGKYEWWSEALHGVSDTGPGVKFGGEFPGATSFPQVITTAASFNVTLWELIARAISDEARAMYNGGQAGLTFWSPNVNIFRDPRWGRGQETPGEDPIVAGRYAVAFVRGLQQPYGGHNGHSKLKLAACCKHYTAYDLDNWNYTDRFHFNAKVSDQDLEDTFSVPFKKCVLEGRVASVMCSYNQVNGIPMCANNNLLRDTIRDQWHLNGYIASDCDSVDVFYKLQHYTATPEDAVAAALKAGLDLDCGPFLAQYTRSALQNDKIVEADINAALNNTITVQMRLGLYDGELSKQPFGNLGPQHVCTEAHQNLAFEAARQGIVLLKNDNGTLPLAQSQQKIIAVIGPHSDATVGMIGNYAGVPCGYTSTLKGIGKYTKVVHEMGCTNVACRGHYQPFERAIFAGKHSDATILVVGLDQSIEAEAKDRSELLLPGRQPELISKLSASSNGPVILVLICGGPVDISFAKNDPKIASIIWAGYPGQAGGAAIADIIFGAFRPSGKLPMTWYPQDYVDKVSMTDMAMRPKSSINYPGRTYRFYSGSIVYPFGYGLTYDNFSYSLSHAPIELAIPLNSDWAYLHDTSSPMIRVSHVKCDEFRIPLHIDVKNMGACDGSHPILVYWSPPARHQGLLKQLVAFDKVHVLAGGIVQVSISVDVCSDMSVADVHGVRRIPTGEHKIQIGDITHLIRITRPGSLS